MAMVVYAPWFSGGELWFAGIVLCGVLMLAQFDGISRKRVMWTTAALIAIVGACSLFAADGVPVNACTLWERGSWEWIVAGCWMLDIIG